MHAVESLCAEALYMTPLRIVVALSLCGPIGLIREPRFIRAIPEEIPNGGYREKVFSLLYIVVI